MYFFCSLHEGRLPEGQNWRKGKENSRFMGILSKNMPGWKRPIFSIQMNRRTLLKDNKTGTWQKWKHVRTRQGGYYWKSLLGTRDSLKSVLWGAAALSCHRTITQFADKGYKELRKLKQKAAVLKSKTRRIRIRTGSYRHTQEHVKYPRGKGGRPERWRKEVKSALPTLEDWALEGENFKTQLCSSGFSGFCCFRKTICRQSAN